MHVTLRDITADTVRQITDLKVAPEQEAFVASNAVSLAEALFAPAAWYRAIYLDDEPVGFVMLYDETRQATPPAAAQITLWRFMVDARYQGRGIGRMALARVIAHVQALGRFPGLRVSCVPDPGSPEPFYRRCGFLPTGEIDDGEIVLQLSWSVP